MDPGSVPAELQGLTQTEEMLIARCCPIMRVLHLKGGQLGYGIHCQRKKTLRARHASYSARIELKPRPQDPDGLPGSTYL